MTANARSMAVASDPYANFGRRPLYASLEVNSTAEDAFALLCAVEKWPVWLSFLRSARLVSSKERLGVGSEVIVRSSIPGEHEQLYEVDAFMANYHLSLVGAYSVRRRFDFRIERRTSCSRVHVRLAFPAYHGRVGALVDDWRRGRKLAAALCDALVHFKGLVEFRRDEPLLADF